MTQNLARLSIAEQSNRTSTDSLEFNRKSRASKSRRGFSAKEVRPQMVEVVEQAIHDVGLLEQLMLDKAFAMGMQLTQYKRILGKGKHKIEYDTIVRRVGLTKPLANKYIKLVEIFGDFSTKLLKFIKLQTLFELCKAKYADVVERMRNRTDLDDLLVRQWIKETKPAPKLKPKQDPVSGWQRMPSGGGRFYQVVHDEETGVAIDKIAKQENLLPQQITKKAIAEYKQRHHQSAEDYWNVQIDCAALESAITWEDVERAVNSDRKRFNRVVKDWTDEKKAGLTTILAAYLNDNPDSLANLVWLPTSLIVKALLQSLLANLKLTAIAPIITGQVQTSNDN